jgi:tetratricopeptide (TPR) repeat protein
MSSDTSPDTRILTAAEGYCELGMYMEAWNELEHLAADERATGPVVKLRLAILVGLKHWSSTAVLAQSFVAKGCRDPDVYIAGAYCIRRCRTLAEAKEFLLQGEQHNPECSTIHYNLACYAAQLGEPDDAKQRLERAIKLEPRYRAAALEDEDLEPLWNSCSAT